VAVGGRAADGGRLLADIKSRVRRGQPLELLLPTSGAVDDVLNEPRPEARVLRLRIVCHQCRLLDNRRSGLKLYSVIVTRCRPAGGETICPPPMALRVAGLQSAHLWWPAVAKL